MNLDIFKMMSKYIEKYFKLHFRKFSFENNTYIEQMTSKLFDF